MTMNPPEFEPPRRSWPAKFHAAGRALTAALWSQSSFHVHAVATLLVLAAAALLQMGRLEWCLLLLCITTVLAAEMFNTAIEILARAVDREFNSYLARALDTSSGAVLMMALGAVLVGAVLFLHRAAVLLGG
jgi:diacylglycerol kinase